MSNTLRWLFSKVTFTCHFCGARQRIPLRRVHVFERFHGLDQGQAVLIACPMCGEGVQVPSPYRTHNGQPVSVDPENPSKNAVLHVG